MDSDYKKMLHDMAWYSLKGSTLLSHKSKSSPN